MKITAVARPFLLACEDGVFRISAEEAQRLLDTKPTIIRATSRRVVMSDPDSKVPGRVVLMPATHSGGPAFIIEGRQIMQLTDPISWTPTVKDSRPPHAPGYYTRLAIELLCDARRNRQAYADRLAKAIKDHGDTDKTPISGIYAEHFPEVIKGDLRAYARNIGILVDNAIKNWKLAGRRLDSLRPYLQEARVIDGGRVSYY